MLTQRNLTVSGALPARNIFRFSTARQIRASEVAAGDKGELTHWLRMRRRPSPPVAELIDPKTCRVPQS